MPRRSSMLVAGSALALASLVAPLGSVTRVGAGTATSGSTSPAVEIVAGRVPSGGSGSEHGGVAVLDIDAQAVIPVTTTTDGAPGSLRAAIETMAVSAGGDAVVLEPGATYVLTCAAGGALEHGDTPLEIEGNGATMTIEPACEEAILVNGSGALVIRDVHFTGLDLAPTSELTAIVETDGPFSLIGGRVADNRVDTGTHALNGYFWMSEPAAVMVVEGTVFENNTRVVGADCGLFCVNGDLEVRNIVVIDTAVDARNGCGGVACVGGDLEFVDSNIATTVNTGTSHCGGIVCSIGDLTLTRTSIAGTSSTVSQPGSLCGGILCSAGGLTLVDSAVTGTSASGPVTGSCGGGLFCGDGDADLVRSTVSGSRVHLTGGTSSCGSMACTSGGMSLVNSTVADNVTIGGDGLPGAFTVDGPVELVYATFVGNSGSGLPAWAPSSVDEIDFVTFASVLAGSGPGGTCGPTLDVTSNGANFADDVSCGLAGTGDRQSVGTGPGLGALADNGGPGPTMLPAPGSPLIDAVAPESCSAQSGITTDERGRPRPSSLSPRCDIGAVEVQPVPIVITPTFAG